MPVFLPFDCQHLSDPASGTQLPVPCSDLPILLMQSGGWGGHNQNSNSSQGLRFTLFMMQQTMPPPILDREPMLGAVLL